MLSVGDEIALEVGTELGTAHGIVGKFNISVIVFNCLKPYKAILFLTETTQF